MLNNLRALAAQVLIALLLASLAAGGGWLIGRDQVQKKWDLAEARAMSAAEKSLRESLEEAVRKGEILSTQLVDAEQTINTLTLEKTHALQKTTTGRPCFNAATVRVLNRPSGTAASVLPAAPGTSDAAGGAVATDTDVAGWITLAQGRFETCRARLDALIEFERQR